MGGLRHRYIGCINSEEEGGRIYDYYAILSHGVHARTNFSYTKSQLESIIKRFNMSDLIDSPYLMR